MHTDGAGSRHPGRRAPPLAPPPQPGALRRFRAALRPSAGSALPLSLLRPARRWLRHFAGSAPAPGVAAPGGCARPAAALRVPLILLETSQTIQHGKSVDNIGKARIFFAKRLFCFGYRRRPPPGKILRRRVRTQPGALRPSAGSALPGAAPSASVAPLCPPGGGGGLPLLRFGARKKHPFDKICPFV